MTTKEFMTEVLHFFGEEHDQHWDLWWRVWDGEVRFFVNCNDLFCWACADSEDITPENFPMLRQCFDDVRALYPKHSLDYRFPKEALNLFCARMRKERPQGAAYPKNRDLWPLFDACGPEREIDQGNPYKPGEREAKEDPKP